MRSFIEKYDRQIYRLLEILPGFVSWNLILFPYWGIFLFPLTVAYYILIFDIYWFYQSLQITGTVILSHLKIQASMQYNWISDLKNFPDWKKIHHVVIVPTYKEPLYILERTLSSLANQDLPTKQITVIVAMEEREDAKERSVKSDALIEKFKGVFGNLFITIHKLAQGEIIGKSSNERYAAIWTYNQLFKRDKKNISYYTVTSCDSDHTFHQKHFSCLTFKFLDSPNRYNYFWQPAVLFYNNIWKLPAITRVPNTLGSIWNLSQLPRKDRLINAQNYSLSFKLLHGVDYWDPDKIPEDWGIFFKAYYKNRGKIEVEPIYLPIYADAAISTTFLKTIKTQYEQFKRWAWGVSDDPWIIKNYFLTPGVPFIDKTMRLIYVIWAHFLWPVNWFIITLGLTVPTLLNPAFGKTAIGYTIPKLSSFILTISLSFLLVMLIIDYFYKPKKPDNFPFWRTLLIPLEFVLMPLAGFIFSALPGLDAHTRLMLGKYIEYKVTEKV